MAREFTIRNINGGSRRIAVPGDGPKPLAVKVNLDADRDGYIDGFTRAAEGVEEVEPDGEDLG